MVPVSIALSDLFKVTIIQRQINVNSTSRQRQLPITGVLALPRPLCETARDVRVKCVRETHFSDALHQCIGRTDAFHPSPW